jgi:Fe-S-cluster-containing dehydrogenase component
MTENIRYGLLIDYEYCTGCFTCQVACSQEYQRPKDQLGIQVIETTTIKPNGELYLAYLPFPTENCNLCIGRTSRGDLPSCVKHCMANVIKYGSIKKLSNEMKKSRMVLWTPK